jgi:phosphatidylglycerol:prolipoprotein diacylglycerol transferase
MEQLLHWWQTLPSRSDPAIFTIGSYQLTYYALSYIAGFSLTYFLALYRLKTEEWNYSKGDIQDCMLFSALAGVIGGRLGHVILHDPAYYVRNPLRIFLPVDITNGFAYTGISGMAFYGGLIGIILTSLVFCHKRKIRYLRFVDLFTPAIPLGLALGRLANFVNGEFYGRITNMPWGMYFSSAPTHRLRHPSQLYEALLEGALLFVTLWALRKKRYFDGFISGMFIIGYGAMRFMAEFARQPDHSTGFILDIFTLGHLLCVAMIAGGFITLRLVWRFNYAKNGISDRKG